MLAPFMTEQRAERISRIVANRTRNVLPIVEVGGWLLLACLPGFAHKRCTRREAQVGSTMGIHPHHEARTGEAEGPHSKL